MIEDKIINHIDYIVGLAGIEGHKLTKIRVVKFLYLAEVLYMKYLQKRLTNWTWKFWDFGPYCVESLKALQTAEKKKIVTSKNIQSKFSENEDDEFSLYEYSRESFPNKSDLEKHIEQLEENIPAMVKHGLRDYVKKYGDNTDALLNYVYYQTEPMENASPRKELDFSSISPISELKNVNFPKLPRKKEKRAKEIIKKMTKEMLEKRDRSLVLIKSEKINKDYIRGMNILNRMDEEDEEINDSGHASIEDIVPKLKANANS